LPWPHAVGQLPEKRTSFGAWYVRPDSRKTSVQTCSVLRSTCETKRAPASSFGGAGAGPCCWTVVPPSEPSIMPSSWSGLMPKIQPTMTAMTMPPMLRPRPPKPKPPPPPPMPRTSSTLLLSSWPSMRMSDLPRGVQGGS
jgi:hypothetical protein